MRSHPYCVTGTVVEYFDKLGLLPMVAAHGVTKSDIFYFNSGMYMVCFYELSIEFIKININTSNQEYKRYELIESLDLCKPGSIERAEFILRNWHNKYELA